MKKLRLARAATAMFLAVAGPSAGVVALAATPATAQTPVMVTSGGEGNLGAGHSCALDSDGTVWCWGDELVGPARQPERPGRGDLDRPGDGRRAAPGDRRVRRPRLYLCRGGGPAGVVLGRQRLRAAR